VGQGALRSRDGIDLACGPEVAQRAALVVVLDAGGLEERRRVRLAMPAGFVDGALDPADGGEIDTVLVDQMAANPDRGGHRIERDPDAPAGEILRPANIRSAIDVDVAVPQ